jgi:hypothetical protein
MEDKKIGLPIILMAAIVQGWALYGLHDAIQGHHWPATHHAWLIALYAVAVFVPVTLQILAEHARAVALWRLVALLGVIYFYFGWHNGSAVFPDILEQGRNSEGYFQLALSMAVLWLLMLPFAQIRLATGRWAIQYSMLFTYAWRNKLVLGEAGLFTGLFWLLLFLWQTLFHMLGIDYFRELFAEPIFVYPVTSLTFGCALHLIGSIERLTAVVLEQILNVLKWLGLVAAVILAFFTIALVFKLPDLVFTGQKAIGAAWLLWLIAVVVLLLNAAYRDGSVAQPYPKWIALFLRVVVPLMVIVAATALYAVMMRSRHYGLTVERVWAFVVAGAALLYSVGYSATAFGRAAWLGRISRVNVIVALALIAVIAATMTPVLSPYRLAANSQFQLVREKGLAVEEDKRAAQYSYARNTPLHYLRFDCGRYGLIKLQELADLQNGRDAEGVRRVAKALLAQKIRWQPVPATDIRADLAKLHVYPVGRSLDKDLIDALIKDLENKNSGFGYQAIAGATAGIFIDLNADKVEEFVLLTKERGLVYERQTSRWILVGNVAPEFPYSSQRDLDLAAELAKGKISAIPAKWNELSIDGFMFAVRPVMNASTTVQNPPPP